MKALSAIFVFGLAVFGSCDILRDSRFEVSGWSPGGGRHGDPGQIEVALNFSREPDRSSVERHFSLAEDGKRLKGGFRWEGRTMRFFPAAPLEINRDYAINLSAEAHDEGGLSMDAAFEGRFSTRPESLRPVLLSFYPEMDAVIDDLRAEVKLEFSQPPSLVSLYDNVSFRPAMNGSWRVDGNTAVFTPVEPWSGGKRYELAVGASLEGNTGLASGRDHASVFTAGADREKPVLTGAWRITETGGDEELAAETTGVFRENPGWEKGDRLKLAFSEPVDLLSVKNRLSAEGGPGLILESAPGFGPEALFGFEKAPSYESRFTFRLKAGIRDRSGNESAGEYAYRIFADGSASRPPELAGIRLPLAPGNAADPDLIAFSADSLFALLPVNEGEDRYPSKKDVETWIEFYFKTAPNTAVDPLSLMDLFRVETSNNVLTFSPRQVISGNFAAPEAEAGWASYQRLAVRGFLTNTTNFGIVHVVIAPGLRDSGGNRSEKTFRVSLIK